MVFVDANQSAGFELPSSSTPTVYMQCCAVQEMKLSKADTDDDDLIDVFDVTEAEPDMLFVNPFACQVDPLRWQELQVHISYTARVWSLHP